MWKKSEIWKNRKFQILLLFEFLLLCIGIMGLLRGNRTLYTNDTMEISLLGGTYLAESQEYYVDGGQGVSGEWLQASGFSLTPGVYELKINYDTTENGINSINMEASGAGFYGLMINEIALYSGIQEAVGQFYVTDWLGEEELLHVSVAYNGVEAFTVKGIEIIKTNAGSRIFLFCVILLSLLINSLAMLYVYMGKYPVSRQQKLIWFGIPVIAILASLPIMIDYIIIGADFIFHMMRIEFLAKTIVQGVFPARVESMWLYGHGYANSIFYCDTFLLLPALLRLIGFPITVAYNLFVFAVNLATAVVAYISFKGMFRNKLIGMFGSLLYTLAPYRIYNIYNRSAIGEYTAMIFLPLVCYGFYLLFTQDVKKKEYRSYWLVLALGFSGIIQSHVLSCEIAFFYAALLCIFCIKRVFRKETFLQLLKAVVTTLLLNLWFLVPLLDMMMSDKYRYSQNAGMHIQMRGILPAVIWYTAQNAGSNSRFHEYGMLDTEPINAGIAIMIGGVAFLFMFREQKKQNSDLARTGMSAFIIGMVAIIMSTCYFPWDSIQAWNDTAGVLMTMIQFPTRLITVACVCLTVSACVAAVWILGKDKIKKLLFFGSVCISCIFFSLYQVNDVLDEKDGILRVHTMEAVGHSCILGAEYLPLGVDFNFWYHDVWPSDSVTVQEFKKENLDTVTTLSVAGSAEQKENWIELPMLYYKGYRAEDVDTGEQLYVCSGTNGHVRVMLESGYQGTVHAWYSGMWYWRTAEIISLLSVLVIVGYVCWKCTENKTKQIKTIK